MKVLSFKGRTTKCGVVWDSWIYFRNDDLQFEMKLVDFIIELFALHFTFSFIFSFSFSLFSFYDTISLCWQTKKHKNLTFHMLSETMSVSSETSSGSHWCTNLYILKKSRPCKNEPQRSWFISNIFPLINESELEEGVKLEFSLSLLRFSAIVIGVHWVIECSESWKSKQSVQISILFQRKTIYQSD